jgi:hypothetical protein
VQFLKRENLAVLFSSKYFFSQKDPILANKIKRRHHLPLQTVLEESQKRRYRQSLNTKQKRTSTKLGPIHKSVATLRHTNSSVTKNVLGLKFAPFCCKFVYYYFMN